MEHGYCLSHFSPIPLLPYLTVRLLLLLHDRETVALMAESGVLTSNKSRDTTFQIQKARKQISRAMFWVANTERLTGGSEKLSSSSLTADSNCSQQLGFTTTYFILSSPQKRIPLYFGQVFLVGGVGSHHNVKNVLLQCKDDLFSLYWAHFYFIMVKRAHCKPLSTQYWDCFWGKKKCRSVAPLFHQCLCDMPSR